MIYRRLLIMNLVVFMTFLLTFQVFAESKAQKVTLNVKNKPLSEVLHKIQQQSGMSYFFRGSNIASTKVSTNVHQKELHVVLDGMLKDKTLVWQIEDGIIIIAPSHPSKPASGTRVQQSVLTGTVRDESNSALVGVTVTVKGTSIATSTDVMGAYRIEMPNNNEVLVFSMMGFVPREIAVRNQQNINVTLESVSTELDDVVVVGMDNRQTKRAVTGAISTIQTKELVQSPVANLSNALAGRLPGLITLQTSGEPGADGASLFIRGIGTYGNSAPLVVIDGLPRAQADFNQLDANEIESVSILKDAASSALYGIQGANGIIVVTTKRGSKVPQSEISFTAQTALQQPIRLPQMMDTYEQALFSKELDYNNNLPVRYTDDILEIIRTGSEPYLYPSVNWFDVILKDVSSQNQYNINFSGNQGNKIRYFLSGSYIKQGTMLRHDDIFEDNYGVKSKFDRYNFRSNVDYDATSMLTLRVDLAGRLENRTGPGAGFQSIFEDITARSPASQPVFNPDGSIGAGSNLEVPFQRNPYGLITQNGYYSNYTNVMYGTLSAKHKLDFITPGLDVQLFFSFENNNLKTTSRLQEFDSFWYRGEDSAGEPIYQQHGISSRISTSGGSSIQRYNYTDFRINYNRRFGVHNVSAQILGNRTLRIFNDELPYAYQGVSSHITYDMLSRYFLELNLGYNGSENFPPGKRYGLFPAFSAGWILSEESFMKDVSWLKLAKIRGSYGVAGNDKIGGNRWLHISDYAPGGGYAFGVSPVVAPGFNENRVGNPIVTWERSAKSNLGVDVSLFNNSWLQLTFDVFKERRENILTAPGDVPDFVAIENLAPRNSGIVENRGYETELRFNKAIGSWRVFSTLQFTRAKNKVLENDQPNPAFDYQDLRGYPIGYQLGYQAVGLFKDEDDIANSPMQRFSNVIIPGDIKYADINNDGEINEYDRVPIQTTTVPDMVGGFSLGAAVKGFDFSFLLNGAKGATPYVFLYPGSRLWLERWTPENLDARIPLASASSNNPLTSDFFIQKSDYLKLRNAEIGYELPVPFISKIRLKYARVYINGQNLLVWDTIWLKDRDPESSGIGRVNYPIQRVFNFGLNVKF